MEGASCWPISAFGETSSSASSGSGYAKFPEVTLSYLPSTIYNACSFCVPWRCFLPCGSLWCFFLPCGLCPVCLCVFLDLLDSVARCLSGSVCVCSCGCSSRTRGTVSAATSTAAPLAPPPSRSSRHSTCSYTRPKIGAPRKPKRKTGRRICFLKRKTNRSLATTCSGQTHKESF